MVEGEVVFFLKETTGMLTVVAFLDGQPFDLTVDLFARLESQPRHIRSAKPWTVRSLLTSMRRLRQHVSASFVRLVHEKVNDSLSSHFKFTVREYRR